MYRKTDPITSKISAQELIDSGKLGERQAQVLWLLGKYPGRTHGELAALIYIHFRSLGILSCAESPHKRLPELEKKGKAYPAPEFLARVCRETGKLAQVWYPK